MLSHTGNRAAVNETGDLERTPQRATMTTTRAGLRRTVFGAVVVAALLAGYGIGQSESTPAGSAPTATSAEEAEALRRHAAGRAKNATHDDTGTTPHLHNADGRVTPVGGSAEAGAVGGLTVTSHGLTLAPVATAFTTGRTQPLKFRITSVGGAPVTTYAIVHDKPLHLILIRRDLSGFQHLHPVMAPDGTWSVPLTPAAPGIYRAIADFTAIVGGNQIPTTLGVDLTVAGNYEPAELPAPARQVVVGDHQVSYEGEPRIGSAEALLIKVTTQGRPAALQPYLGAFGHLVVLREGDAGYVHVHPEPQLADGKVKFWLAAPGPGRYRMFFDFQVAGEVRTVAWTTLIE